MAKKEFMESKTNETRRILVLIGFAILFICLWGTFYQGNQIEILKKEIQKLKDEKSDSTRFEINHSEGF